MKNSYVLLEKFVGSIDINQLHTNPQLLMEIQSLLIQAGFLKGKADGKLDSLSIIAFQNFKKEAFLQYSNILGQSTAKALLEIAGKAKHPVPTEAMNIPKVISMNKEEMLTLPTKSNIFLNEKISGSKYFTWAEATHNGTRIPPDILTAQRIVHLARYLDLVR